jgi:hypothetical protein
MTIRRRLRFSAEFAFVATLLAVIVRNSALLALWTVITAAALLFLSYRLAVYVFTTRKELQSERN